MTRGFTSEQSKKCVQVRTENELLDQIATLRKQMTLLKSKKDYYKSKYSETLTELNDYKKANTKLTFMRSTHPYLYKHILSLNEDTDNPNSKFGNRFNEDVVPIYMLLSMSGNYYTNLLHKYFGFPAVRTCQNFRQKMKEQYEIDESTFDGSIESIQRLMVLFLGDIEDRRCVISVDAAAVDAKITIHKDGEVEGLMDKLQLEKELVTKITQNADEFHKFYQQHQQEIIKYYFVFYVSMLNDQNKSFPVLLKKKTNGSADIDITSDLEILYYNCLDAGLQVVGISFDGDVSYLKYVDEMCNQIDKLEKLDLKCPLSTLFKEYYGPLIFEDLLHLVKCDRYRIVCGSRICPTLSRDEATFCREDFKDLNIKDYILDPSKSKKMDDNLPILLFSRENVEKAIQMERYDLLLSLLPSYLLINAVFSPNLTREQRVEQLTFGFSIVITYYNDYILYDFQNGLQSRNRMGGKNQYMTLYDPIWMKKYLSLTISLSKALSDHHKIHLGALGTHFLEHFFGMIRRFCLNNDSAAAFQNAVENIVIYKIVQKEIDDDNIIQPGRSDSGAKIPEITKDIKEIPVNVCLRRAAEIMKKVGPLLNSNLNHIIEKSTKHMIDDAKDDPLKTILYNYANEKKSYYSTSNLRYNSTSGYTSIQRVLSGNTI